ncbi:hypothetical protein BDV12DRAFT_186102 [Aspergillus spectabilis]
MGSSPLQMSVYQQVTTELYGSLDSHGNYWWQTSGYLLAALLRDAGYPASSQQHILTFFGRTVVPHMGVTYNPHSPQWRSFMTDDHHPIELSWDWHAGQKPPTVRFSVEPVGVHAGTSLDAHNEQVNASFHRALIHALPETNMKWFRHFDRELTPQGPGGLMEEGENHPSKIFYAFDFNATTITSKAYFFPAFKARVTNRTNLLVVCDVIARAPQCAPSQLNALRVFEDFVTDQSTPQLEIDMLAIDMNPPAASRLKIYFRNRATSFASVRQMMTLGQRVTHPRMNGGLSCLRKLWDALLDQEGVSDAQPLPETNHRTAGLLYNIELHPGSAEPPKVKIYIPVRHYAVCDDRIISAVHDYIGSVERNGGGLKHDYADTMRRMFQPSALQQRGLHTYIGCSVQASGELRVVSYVNGQGHKMV